MEHCPLRARALWHFFESAPDQLSGDGLFGALQLNGTLGQKTHAPTLFALGRLRAGQSDQMGLLLCIELVGFGGLGPAVDQRRLQPLPGEPLAHPSDRRAAYLQSIGDLGVGPGGGLVGSIFALVGLEQDTRMGQLARRGVATSDLKPSRMPRYSLDKLTGLFLFLGIERPPHVRCRAAARTSGGTHDTREGILLQTNHVRTLGCQMEPSAAMKKPRSSCASCYNSLCPLASYRTYHAAPTFTASKR